MAILLWQFFIEMLRNIVGYLLCKYDINRLNDLIRFFFSCRSKKIFSSIFLQCFLPVAFYETTEMSPPSDIIRLLYFSFLIFRFSTSIFCVSPWFERKRKGRPALSSVVLVEQRCRCVRRYCKRLYARALHSSFFYLFKRSFLLLILSSDRSAVNAYSFIFYCINRQNSFIDAHVFI